MNEKYLLPKQSVITNSMDVIYLLTNYTTRVYEAERAALAGL